jgi:Fe-S oxidoreductase
MQETTHPATLEHCTGCNICKDCCQLLRESDCTPAELAWQGVTLSDALSCSFCGACQSACPLGLWPGELFANKRCEAVSSGEFDVQPFRYLFPDRPNNVMAMYRKQYGIEYADLAPTAATGTCFFPGCTLMSYSPVLTRAVFARLQEQVSCQAIWTDCCGKLLEQLGLQERLQQAQEQLISYAREHAITRIITACPGCYYDLKKLLQPVGICVESVYDILDFKSGDTACGASCTVHDSCPDRFTGQLGRQVREALQQQGYTLIEMPHSGRNTICCGSGGQLSHFRPDLVEELTALRHTEFMQTGATYLVAYCLSCVLKYDSMLAGLPVTHALSLLLDLPADYAGAKERSLGMFEGPEGEQRWAAVMAD